jgi:hypothetical protein
MNFDKYVNNLPWATVRESNKTHEAYYLEEARLRKMFEEDLFANLGITDNPKRHKLLQKAWGMGHSAGYSEVYSYASDLVELIED